MSGLTKINNSRQNNILVSTYYVCQDAEKHCLHITSHKPRGMVVLLYSF